MAHVELLFLSIYAPKKHKGDKARELMCPKKELSTRNIKVEELVSLIEAIVFKL